jgi:hypothetical protein
MRSASICLVAVMLAGLAMAQGSPAKNGAPAGETHATSELQAPPELSRLDPLQLLGVLKSKAGTPGWMTIQQPVHDWVRAEHIPKLIKLLNSHEPCRPVVMADASVLPEHSTVGQEAAMMIAGYRDGLYPSVPTSEDARIGTPAELIAWWKKAPKSKRKT